MLADTCYTGPPSFLVIGQSFFVSLIIRDKMSWPSFIKKMFKLCDSLWRRGKQNSTIGKELIALEVSGLILIHC